MKYKLNKNYFKFCSVFLLLFIGQNAFANTNSSKTTTLSPYSKYNGRSLLADSTLVNELRCNRVFRGGSYTGEQKIVNLDQRTDDGFRLREIYSVYKQESALECRNNKNEIVATQPTTTTFFFPQGKQQFCEEIPELAEKRVVINNCETDVTKREFINKGNWVWTTQFNKCYRNLPTYRVNSCANYGNNEREFNETQSSDNFISIKRDTNNRSLTYTVTKNLGINVGYGENSKYIFGLRLPNYEGVSSVKIHFDKSEGFVSVNNLVVDKELYQFANNNQYADLQKGLIENNVYVDNLFSFPVANIKHILYCENNDTAIQLNEGKDPYFTELFNREVKESDTNNFTTSVFKFSRDISESNVENYLVHSGKSNEFLNCGSTSNARYYFFGNRAHNAIMSNLSREGEWGAIDINKNAKFFESYINNAKYQRCGVFKLNKFNYYNCKNQVNIELNRSGKKYIYKDFFEDNTALTFDQQNISFKKLKSNLEEDFKNKFNEYNIISVENIFSRDLRHHAHEAYNFKIEVIYKNPSELEKAINKVNLE